MITWIIEDMGFGPVVVLSDSWRGRETMVLNKQNLEARIETLEKQGYPVIEEKQALKELERVLKEGEVK